MKSRGVRTAVLTGVLASLFALPVVALPTGATHGWETRPSGDDHYHVLVSASGPAACIINVWVGAGWWEDLGELPWGNPPVRSPTFRRYVDFADYHRIRFAFIGEISAGGWADKAEIYLFAYLNEVDLGGEYWSTGQEWKYSGQEGWGAWREIPNPQPEGSTYRFHIDAIGYDLGGVSCHEHASFLVVNQPN